MKRVLLLILLAAPLFANASATSDLERWLAKKVKFEACTEGALTTPEKVRAFVTEVLRKGVERIEEVNPSLMQERMARFKKRATLITCAESPEGSEADTRKPILFIPAKLRIGRPLKDSTSTFSELVIFHEFLHVIAFDNLKPKTHNDAKKLSLLDSEGYQLRERDLVYACSSVAYPSGLWAFDLEEKHVLDTCSKGRIDSEGRVVQHSVGKLGAAQDFDYR